MKKILTVVIAILFLFSFSMSVSADSVIYVYEIGNTAVIFDENTFFSATERENIAQLIVSRNSNDSISYALLCVISGHDYSQYESVTTITHRADDKAPRCLQERFLISKCSRCEHYKTERTSFCYISCCPED